MGFSTGAEEAAFAVGDQSDLFLAPPKSYSVCVCIKTCGFYILREKEEEEEECVRVFLHFFCLFSLSYLFEFVVVLLAAIVSDSAVNQPPAADEYYTIERGLCSD